MIDINRRWLERAACAGMDPEKFFIDGESLGLESPSPTSKRGQAYARAKAVCNSCEVLMECRRDSIGEPHGVWGGLSEGDRAVVLAASGPDLDGSFRPQPGGLARL